MGGEVGRSKLEADIFNLLDLALGPGVNDATVPSAVGGARLDMLFPHDGAALVVEYDGAFFHQDRADTDRRKAHVLRQGQSNLGWNVHVLRIRERPLRRLHPHDVVVPARPTAQQCARVTMLHLLHTVRRMPYADWAYELEARVFSFVQASRPLDPQTIDCRACRRLEQRFIDNPYRHYGRWHDPAFVWSAGDALAAHRDEQRAADEQRVISAGASLLPGQ